MGQLFVQYMQSPLGWIELKGTEEYLTAATFVDDKKDSQSNTVLLEAEKQLKEYFAKKRKKFDLPLQLEGTSFRKEVWEALLTIPYGGLVSYKDIAVIINKPQASRAIGQANHFNPIAIIVPCHRVIGTNGKLVGYGSGLDKKEYLINLEKTN